MSHKLDDICHQFETDVPQGEFDITALKSVVDHWCKIDPHGSFFRYRSPRSLKSPSQQEQDQLDISFEGTIDKLMSDTRSLFERFVEFTNETPVQRDYRLELEAIDRGDR